MNREAIGLLLKRDIVRVAQAGSISGSIAGFAGLIEAHGDGAAAGATAAGWTWLLAIALPLGLALTAVLENRRSGGMPYAAPSAAALIRLLLAIGLFGGLGGAVLEFVVASYIPTLFSFGHLDLVTVRAALVHDYPLIAIPAALGTTALVAIVEGVIFRARHRSVNR